MFNVVKGQIMLYNLVSMFVGYRAMTAAHHGN